MSLPVQDMACEQDSGQDGFCPVASDSEWCENLKRYGSCKRLLELLTEDPTLIHGLGDENMTVLHKGVEHGCVALVRFVLVDMFDDRGHCKCGQHGAGAPALTREQLLRKTCTDGRTAVNMAVLSGSPKMVVLLEWAIEVGKRLSEQSTTGMASWNFWNKGPYRTSDAIRSSYEEKKGRKEEIQPEITNDRDKDIQVPDVKDDDLSILTHKRNSEVERKVISVIEGVLEDPGDEHREWMDMVKEYFAKDEDFEFVPLAHVFLHFLSSVRCYDFVEDGFNYFREAVTERIFKACCDDGEDGESGAMLTTLFNILDPRGRPLAHAVYETGYRTMVTSMFRIMGRLSDISPSIEVKFWNTRDGAGRSIFHLMAIHDGPDFEELHSVFSVVQSHEGGTLLGQCEQSPQDLKLGNLKKWCFPLIEPGFRIGLTPVELALLTNSRKFLTKIWPSDGSRGSASGGKKIKFCTGYYPLQLAAALGRAAIIENMLKHHTKFNSLQDLGLGNGNSSQLPAIHCAVAYGQVEALQSILKFPMYDPMVQHRNRGTALHFALDKSQMRLSRNRGTALHFALDKSQMRLSFDDYHDALLCHIWPKSLRFKRAKEDVFKLVSKQDETPRVYTSNEISCINLLLQAGIDIWTPHVWTKGLPSPGPLANDEARKWWFEKVVNEVVVLKTSVSYAANATSVVAALVATASFIGPFQPPLGYGEEDGFVRLDQSPLQVYWVCNSISFYFSIASILMSLLPAIPMPKESLYDELLRSQRCLKGAALMLLISIVTTLMSFSSASMAVVSSEWHKRQVVVGCVIFGGAICVAVLVVYIIRLLRLLFHRNDKFRRLFARYMYF